MRTSQIPKVTNCDFSIKIIGCSTKFHVIRVDNMTVFSEFYIITRSDILIISKIYE